MGAPVFSRHRVESSVVGASNPDDNDGLIVYLIASMFTSTAALYASMIMGAAVIVCSWLMTHEPIFLFYLALNAIIGVARLHLIYRHTNMRGPRRARVEIALFDHPFTFWSSLYAFVLGMTAYSLISRDQTVETAPLAIGLCVGFTLAYVNRSSGRMHLLVLQVLGSAGPAAYGYATLPIVHGRLYATMLVGLIISAMIMGKAVNGKLIELYRANEQNSRLARMDGLTGLMNRFSFSEALAVAMAARDGDRRHAVFMIDLDRFKEINDTLGHSVGDAVIVEMGLRLRRALRDSDILARLGGDEFVILARAPEGSAGANRDAERLVDALSKPLIIDHMSLPASASIGVALYPDHAASGEELMKLADIALYEAKHRGRNAACVFDASMQARINDVQLLKHEIQSAIQSNQFEPWFQPIVDLRSGKIAGYEALARWRHPSLGVVAPNRFIPLAEQSGSIFQIGEMILEKACRAAMTWRVDTTVAVNFSAVQFRRPQGLVEMVRAVLRQTGLAPSRLYLEITESLLMEDTPQTREAIRELARLGVRFSLDDFGSGYSSLSYIQHYPFSRIKIDKRFVDHIDTDNTSSAILAAVLVLAERIGLDVVAEGVETVIQQEALRKIGLTQAQGYLYGRPTPVLDEPPLKVVGL